MSNEIVAIRTLKLASGQDVLVNLFSPYVDRGDFRCDYRIDGVGSGKIGHAYGIDAIQGLILALKNIGTQLYTSSEWESGELSWPDAGVERDLGFPVPEIIKDIPPSLP